jgi:hypothetical protein
MYGWTKRKRHCLRGMYGLNENARANGSDMPARGVYGWAKRKRHCLRGMAGPNGNDIANGS